MPTEPASPPNWASPETYLPLLKADTAVWAWEFGRRAPAAAETQTAPPTVDPAAPNLCVAEACSGASIPGLCFVGEAPNGGCVPAVMWRWEADPSMPVLTATSAGPCDPQALDLRGLELPALVVHSDDGDQHVMVVDGSRCLRFAVLEGDVLSGPVRLRYHLPGSLQARANMDSLRCLVALRGCGRLPAPKSIGRRAARRWLQALQVHDARCAGASQRDIARALFGEAQVREDWNGRSDYMRMRVQRLVRTADQLVAGGYRELLGIGISTLNPGRVDGIWRSSRWIVSSMLAAMFVAGCGPKAPAKAGPADVAVAAFEAEPVCLAMGFTLSALVEPTGIDANRTRLAALAGVGLLSRQPASAGSPAQVSSGPQDASVRFQATPGAEASLRPAANRFVGGTDLCFAKRRVLKVVSVEPLPSSGDQKVSRVIYTYELVDIAPWTRDAAVQAAFPAIGKALATPRGERSETFVRTADGWKQHGIDAGGN